jgi:hypothetical protein
VQEVFAGGEEEQTAMTPTTKPSKGEQFIDSLVDELMQMSDEDALEGENPNELLATGNRLLSQARETVAAMTAGHQVEEDGDEVFTALPKRCLCGKELILIIEPNGVRKCSNPQCSYSW